MLTKKDIELYKKYQLSFDVKYKCKKCDVDLNINNVAVNTNNSIVNNYFILYNDGFICKECYDKIEKCAICGYVNKELFLVKDKNQKYCRDCISLCNCRKCVKCSCYFSYISLFIEHYGAVCDECSKKTEYFKCTTCDGYFLNSRYGIDGICITCANERIRNCLNYTFKPFLQFNYMPSEEHSKRLYMGVELECGYAKTPIDVMSFIENNANSFFYMKRDASIPAYGCEVVTHPATLAYHTSDKCKWDSLLKDAQKYGLNSDNEKCGIHIHVNRNYFLKSEINKLDYYINYFSELFKILARRESHYSAYVNKQFADWGIQTTNRHCALNLSNEHTIEFRIFKGTLEKNILFAYMQIVYCISLYVKTPMQKDDFQKEFIAFCKQQKFTELNEYLNSLNL